jgi:hypothetical protein
MTTETSQLVATIITTLVIPIALRMLAHYFPWLADSVVPGAGDAVKPPEPTTPAPPAADTVYDLDAEES